MKQVVAPNRFFQASTSNAPLTTTDPLFVWFWLTGHPVGMFPTSWMNIKWKNKVTQEQTKRFVIIAREEQKLANRNHTPVLRAEYQTDQWCATSGTMIWKLHDFFTTNLTIIRLTLDQNLNRFWSNCCPKSI